MELSKTIQAGIVLPVKILRKRALALLIMLLSLNSLSAQNINKVEYFFDNDPGFGNGNNVTLIPAPNITNLSFSADITGLSNGFHQLFVRAMQDYGKWSVAYLQSFYKASVAAVVPNIVKVEYYFDNDPGFGNATDVPITPSPNVTSLSFSAGTSALASGMHKLFVRAKGTDGIWSTTTFQPFIKTSIDPALQNVVAAEYFIDNDPGFGNATAVAVTPALNVTNLSFNIDITNLYPGFHKLLTRVRDANGNWSVAHFWDFYKGTVNANAGNIVNVEYYFDSDPGFGNAQQVSISPGTNVTVNWTAGIESLPVGFHRLFVRAKEASGLWGPSHIHPFVKQLLPDSIPNVVSLEYFYDTDPGFGNGFNVGLTPGQTIPFKAWSLNLGNLAYGNHQLFVRTKDAYGKWSVATTHNILYYLDTLPTATLSGPEFACVNSPAPFEVTLSGIPPWTVIYNDGFQVDTAIGISVSPFVFHVNAQGSGMRTASILTVHDLYYNGLNVGIPLEYEVIVCAVPPGLSAISGTLKYDNNSHTHLTYSNVSLKHGDIVYAQTNTSNTGDYSFDSIPAGTYILSASTAKPWQGVNATDALLIQKHFAGITPLVGLRAPAGDVNASGFLNSTDAFLSGKRFVGLVDTFAAGDWYFEKIQLNVTGSSTIVQDISGLCFGDVNASNNPGAKVQPSVYLTQEGIAGYQEHVELEIPVLALQFLETYAFSLVFNIPDGITVTGLKMEKGDEINLVYHVSCQQLRIAWYDLNPITLNEGEALLKIRINVTGTQPGDWGIDAESSITDVNGDLIGPINLTIPKMVCATGFQLAGIYPNPFSHTTSIAFILPSDGHVRISILNLLGEEITRITDNAMDAGSYNITYDGSTLQPGIYYFQILAETRGRSFESTKKLVKIR